MPLRLFKCPVCEFEVRTFKEKPECDHDQLKTPPAYMVPVICAPETKFMEPMDKDRGKSDIKDKTKILKERTRSYVRDNELVELTLKNNDHTAQKKQWIKADGSVRKKIDDI